MIETKAISEKYASMPDSELIQLATEEGHLLTMEGLNLLKIEFNKRNLNHDAFSTTEIKRTASLDIKKEKEAEQYQNSNTSLIYAFDQKENGRSNEEIIAGLMETGIEESTAAEIIYGMEPNARLQLKKAEHEKLIGATFFICGLAFTFLPHSITSNRLIYIIGWSAIIFGSLKYIKGMYSKSRFRKILLNISTEKFRRDFNDTC